MLAATDGAAPVCSIADQVKVLLIAVQELHVWPVQIYVVWMLLSYRPCMTDESEANVARKLDTRSESRKKSFWPPWHAWHLNGWCSCDRSFLYLFHFNPSSHSSRGIDWLLRHFTLSYEIKYTAGGLSYICSKSQQLWLIYSALDRGETYSDELLATWFFQIQKKFIKENFNIYTHLSSDQKGRTLLVYYRSEREPEKICRQKHSTGARNKLPNNQRNWATPCSTEFNRPNPKFNKS
jgi:hypothetical protein